MVKIILKCTNKIENYEIYTLSNFFKEFFNEFYEELNSLLSDYHSIQEHGNRIKIIDFLNKMKKNLDLLQIAARGCFLLKDLDLVIAKGRDSSELAKKLIEIADFLASIYSNMKNGFIPKPSFGTALEVQLDYYKLLPRTYKTMITEGFKEKEEKTENYILQSKNFESIHRIMRIYLLKERKASYELNNGVLILKTEFFEFHVLLCGDLRFPQWRIFKTISSVNNSQVDDFITKRFSSSLSELLDFINIFIINKKALEIFQNLEGDSTGFYKKFNGKIKNLEISGKILNDSLFVSIMKNKTNINLKNPNLSEILKLADEDSEKYEEIKQISNRPKEFYRDVFGENFTLFKNGLFISFSTIRNICSIGKLTNNSSLDHINIRINYSNADISADYDTDAAISKQCNIEINNYIEKCQLFVAWNYFYLHLALLISDLNIKSTIHTALETELFTFRIVNSIGILYLNDGIEQHFEIYDENSILISNVLKTLENKIRLVYLQKKQVDGFSIIYSKLGKNIELIHQDININVGDKFHCSSKYLLEDCHSFNINEAIEFTKKFAIFYRSKLFPFVSYHDRILFDFSFVSDEIITIKWLEAQNYEILGSKTIELLKLPKIFKDSDTDIFQILYKTLLTQRYFTILNLNQIQNANGSCIELGENKSIKMKPDGLYFECDDENYSIIMSKILNTERSFLKYLNMTPAEVSNIY